MGGGDCWQDVLNQWQFIFIRRQVEKGRYYHECNQLRDDEEAPVAASIRGAQDNHKVTKNHAES
jgi:hypothetical protein